MNHITTKLSKKYETNNTEILKKNLYILRYLLIAIAFYSAALIIETSNTKLNAFKLEVDNIQKTLHKQETEIEKYIEIFSENLKNNNYTKDPQNGNLFFEQNYEKLDEKGFTIIIYRNDSLKFWSNNYIEMSEVYTGSKLYNRIFSGNNSVHVIETKNMGEFVILGLIKLKNKFSYQNKYLKNDISSDFNLPQNLGISEIPISHGFDILDKDNNYIFSFVPEEYVKAEKLTHGLLGLMYIFSALFMILFFSTSIISLSKSGYSYWWVIILIISIFILKILMIKLKIPQISYSLPLFDSQYYASSFLFPSLGDFLINSLFIAFFVYHILSFIDEKFARKIIKKQNKILNITVGILSLNIIYFFFFAIHRLLKSLIIDSNILFEVYNILSLNLFSILAFAIFIILASTYIYLNVKIFDFLKEILELKQLIITFLISLLPAIIFVLTYYTIDLYSAFFIIAISTLTAYSVYKKYNQKYYIYIGFAFFTTLFISLFVISTLNFKQDEKAKLIASKLIDERDAVAELLIKDVKNKIKDDETILMYLSDTLNDMTYEKINAHLRYKYFTSYWNKYDFEIHICSDLNQEEDANNVLDCQITYTQILDRRGEKLEGTDCYFIKNDNGSISYYLSESYDISENNLAILYIFINPKLIEQDIGYPELLLDEKINISQINPNYSNAKYENDIIITKSGDYKYPVDGKKTFSTEKEIDFKNIGEFRNLIYTFQKGNYIVLTYPKITFFDYIITFAYIFIVLNIIVIIIYSVNKLPEFIKTRRLDFRTKLIFSIFFILTISFVFIGGVTFYSNTNQFKSKQNEAIEQKLQSILTMLSYKYRDTKSITNLWKNNELNSIDYELIKMSDVFRNDINLYNKKGRLIATSRSEIFNKNLISTYMNPKVLYELKINKVSEYINDEKIGLLDYTSAYIPLKNENGKILAYINVPFFENTKIQQKEISNLLVTIINLYVIVFIFSIIIAVFLSEQVVLPLRLLQSTFQRLEVGKQYEHINYNQNDEIGELVTEYNKMVDKLHESIELLSKSERESAWRDMAKQIAHEIKNPLTPMKLSIQFLLRAWNNKDENFGNKLERVSTTLIEEIENLRKIATEFSDFAQMPRSKDEKINLVSKIENIIQLYENTEDVNIIANINQLTNVNIIADSKQMSRVFINLIRNAIQSIPSGLQGEIIVHLNVENNQAKIIIEDNGAGIEEDVKSKLFTPSFTTKNSGMGLGLPMVKNIVNNAKGKIWFESEIGKGTKFYLQFPIH